MKLHFLGRGSAFNPALGNTNAYFSSGEDLFFIDFGESAFEKAVRLIDFAAYRHIYVLLTHLHADHSGSLASLVSYTHCVLKREVYIIHPVDTVKTLLTVQGIAPHFYHYMPTLPDGLTVKANAVPVAHADDMHCYGYLIEQGDTRIYYSGDANDLPDDIAAQFTAGQIDFVYHEVTGSESGGHCYIGRLEDKIPPMLRHRVYLMHLDAPIEADLLSRGFSLVKTVDD